MRILITGARGMLGQAMIKELDAHGHRVFPMGHQELDITNLDAVRSALNACEPQALINCAAYTKVDEAEVEEPKARAVNALGVRNLALACHARDVNLVHFSTDYVFDGSRRLWNVFDERRPLNAYGRTKLLGENFLASIAPKFYLVRTSWLFGPGGPNFVDTMLRLATMQSQLQVVNDQHGSPTYTADLAAAVADLLTTGAFGIYHITNQGATTWFGFAREIFRQAGVDIELFPVKTSEFPRPAPRPANSILDPFPLEETIGRLLTPWQEAVGRHLAVQNNIKS